MDEQSAKSLINKYQAGTCTPEEKAIVENWLILGEVTKFNLSDDELEEDLLDLQQRLYTTIAPKRKTLWPRVAVAASILICFGLTFYFYTDAKKESGITTAYKDIAPGSNKAILTLANGAKISITDARNGEILKESGIVVSKTADGQLVYKITERDKKSRIKDEAYHTIETPRGGQHQVILPDGTKVWLNAASSIRFSESFVNVKARNIELKGEAYFEVKKDQEHPFIVKTSRQEIEVLGTHFNISSYLDEQKSITTLLEGSVKVQALMNHNYSVIKPGQQAISKGTKDLNVVAADIDQVLDWKNGDFMFKKESLDGIMRKVCRWYDVNVEYGDEVDISQTYSGLVSRSKNISEVLKIMQAAGQLKFNVIGKKVIVENN
ncbi:FecR family protein [Pedobacter sp. ASV1-7]|uniref:FecR family protein n=1 Tax=Pedobacter sp. ASV1-7 TaxID=3145237 RepID=UPI0032E8C070